MIGSIENASLIDSTGPEKTGRQAGAGGFDAALKAAQKGAEREEARQKELAAIKDKGFSDWVRDTQIEKLKEELRKKVMAEMGLDEDQMGRMSAAAQQILEQKVQEEVERRMQEMAAEEQGKPASTVATAAQPAGKNDLQGKKCPIIPGLAWPGGASVL